MKTEYTQYPKVGGIYTHYKGGKYEVLTLAVHSETCENHVVYKSVEIGCVYVRPLHMFFETVENYEGYKISRFRLFEITKKDIYDL